MNAPVKAVDFDTAAHDLRWAIWQAQSLCTMIEMYTREEVGEHTIGMNIINAAEVARDLLEKAINESNKLGKVLTEGGAA